jgi:hypothetical protein
VTLTDYRTSVGMVEHVANDFENEYMQRRVPEQHVGPGVEFRVREQAWRRFEVEVEIGQVDGHAGDAVHAVSSA